MTRSRLPALKGAALALLLASAAMAQPPPAQPADFAREAAGSDQYEILAARVALSQSRDAQVQAFAREMAADHTRTSRALAQAAARSGLPPPGMAMTEDQSHLLYGLQGQSGTAFDKLYATQQVVAHRGALTTTQGYAARGSDPNLRQAAAAAVPIIQHHLQMAEQLKAAQGG